MSVADCRPTDSMSTEDTAMTTYRKIWEQHYGPIPKDEDGRTYEIHHIDGNSSNNHIDNLKCVSIQEHYEIHKKQEDWAACKIISTRMKISVEEKEKINEKNGILTKQRFENNPKLREYYSYLNKLQNQNPVIREKRLQALNRKGTIWINNGEENKRILPSEYEKFTNKGWVRGRLILSENKFYEHGNKLRDQKTGRFLKKGE